eukprot:Skav230833  [mRNA]  locus=scaffold3318:103879:105987:+ [translate_table: standard]
MVSESLHLASRLFAQDPRSGLFVLEAGMHLPMSVLLFLVSSMAAAETQPEPEPGCLLQRTHSEAKHAAVPISPIPKGFRSLCPADPNLSCRCAQYQDPRNAIQASLSLEQCASRCGSSVFEYRHDKHPTYIVSWCECCGDVPEGSAPWVSMPIFHPWQSFSVYAGDALSGVEGDPHVRTLDGGHYTLLSQGTFSLWRFSGVHANFMSKDRLGFALLDQAQAAQDSLSAKLEVAWFRFCFKINPAKNCNRVSFVMKDGGNRTEIAVLSISCRSGHSINVAIKMKRASDSRFVNGELRILDCG